MYIQRRLTWFLRLIASYNLKVHVCYCIQKSINFHMVKMVSEIISGVQLSTEAIWSQIIMLYIHPKTFVTLRVYSYFKLNSFRLICYDYTYMTIHIWLYIYDYIALSCLVKLRNSKYNFRYNNILDIPQVRTTMFGNKSFKFAAATLWNSFPDHFRNENSFPQFKSLMHSWNGTECHCSACMWKLSVCFVL